VLTDIVAGRYDAGVRLGDNLAKDMIAVRIGPDLRMAVVGAPSCFETRSRLRKPQDLVDHSCINLRLPTLGGLYAWEFEKAGRELKVRVEGQLVFNVSALALEAALAGLGLAFLLEDHVREHLASGRLIRVLAVFGLSPLLPEPSATRAGLRAPGRCAALPGVKHPHPSSEERRKSIRQGRGSKGPLLTQSSPSRGTRDRPQTER
jgi:DNA-binding transcriptional LysR family regulator